MRLYRYLRTAIAICACVAATTACSSGPPDPTREELSKLFDTGIYVTMPTEWDPYADYLTNPPDPQPLASALRGAGMIVVKKVHFLGDDIGYDYLPTALSRKWMNSSGLFAGETRFAFTFGQRGTTASPIGQIPFLKLSYTCEKVYAKWVTTEVKAAYNLPSSCVSGNAIIYYYNGQWNKDW